MADLTILRTRLSEAEEALHDLQVNRRTVRVTGGDGRSVEYSPTIAAELRRYIVDLKDQIASANGRPRRVILPSF